MTVMQDRVRRGIKDTIQKHAQQERVHLQTVNQLLSGQIPSVTGQGGTNQQQSDSRPPASNSQDSRNRYDHVAAGIGQGIRNARIQYY